MALPDHLKGAIHKASTPYDDDQYWAVKRPDGLWDIYAASPYGGYPEKPFETVSSLPQHFTEDD